jgi:DNA-binding winged helix-turn-helix (wHTH) protein/TolB-like protein
MNRPAPWNTIFTGFAERTPFTVGHATVDPISRDATWPGGSERLQPQTLKVLITLVSRPGEVVTRDELVQLCWDGRIVGEDVINRSISLLRHFAERAGGFEIETVPRAGYRLIERQLQRSWPNRLLFRWSAFAAFALIVAVALGLLWMRPANDKQAAPLVAVAPFQPGNGSQAADFARRLRDGLVDEMGDAGLPTTTEESSAGRRADLVLNGSVMEDGGNLNVFVQIQDWGSGVTLWSRQFEGSAADSQLGTAIAVAAVEPLYEYREIYLQKGLSVGPADLAKMLKIQEMIDNPKVADRGKLRKIYEDAIADGPDIAYAHGNLAVTLVQDGARSPPDQRNLLFAQARSEANTAFRISPAASGGGYDALYLMSVYDDPGNILRQQSLLLNGMRNAPQFPYLIMRECQFLMSIGRNDDAGPYCDRAHAVRPLTAPIEWRVAEALKMRGQPGLAEQAIEQAVHDYPNNGNIRLAKFDILAFGDSPDRAAALLPAMLNQGEGFDSSDIGALNAFLRARSTGNPADAARAGTVIVAAATNHNLRLDVAVKALAVLDRIDDAFALLSQVRGPLPPLMDLAPTNPGTMFLFAPETARLRADPRFWTVANQQGLVSYWITTHDWPDFCGKEQPLAQCQASAARVRGQA